MNRVFLGKPIHWAIGIAVPVLLMLLGSQHFHVRWFGAFILLVFAIGFTVLMAILFTSRPGEAITREPFEEDPPEGTEAGGGQAPSGAEGSGA